MGPPSHEPTRPVDVRDRIDRDDRPHLSTHPRIRLSPNRNYSSRDLASSDRSRAPTCDSRSLCFYRYDRLDRFVLLLVHSNLSCIYLLFIRKLCQKSFSRCYGIGTANHLLSSYFPSPANRGVVRSNESFSHAYSIPRNIVETVE